MGGCIHLRLLRNYMSLLQVCYNEAVRQRRNYKEKPKEAKPLTRKAKRLLLKVKRGEPTN